MVRVIFGEQAMKTRLLMGGLVIAALTLPVGLAGEPIKSGLPVDGKTSPFNVYNVTGPDKDKTLCLV
jgi:hypothetical protein